MKRQEDNRLRPRLSIPPNDTQLIEWIKLQSNFSNSVRKLIKESIAKDGMIDVDCKPVSPGVWPGRPRRTAEETYSQTGQMLARMLDDAQEGGGPDEG